MNRAMLIGSIGAGKSTLTHALLENKIEARKTQSLTYYDWIVDTPGEYTENPLFYKNIMATSLEVTHILYLQDATNKKSIFPPGFSGGFTKLPIGVVTKADSEAANVDLAIEQLKRAITRGPIIVSSSLEKKGLKEIRDLVKCNTMQEMKDYVLTNQSNDIFFHETLYK
ncbi:ethanolamine utilization protein EutP [Pueribacillus theae]|uniref:Ethanolamine utilization protein EutP n=1 Tax=Pueribacillus theae TaxID=2171751 RepID=A0A2U1K693_9BACI|nr:EutP/PduV family microcompartment system protein [Pueribacillus theae]PWA13061.1 ethanolamine utilization protein EutP [Pueribacillus theae]